MRSPRARRPPGPLPWERSDSLLLCSRAGWDRAFVDETNDKNDKYDRGSPDYQADLPDVEREDWKGDMCTYQRPKDLKWRVICAGVARLIEEKRLEAENVMIWCDWQSSAPHRSSNPPDQQVGASPAADGVCCLPPPPRSLPGRQR